MTPDQKSRQQEKLDAAIAWLRERNNYCLDKGSRPYKPYDIKEPVFSIKANVASIRVNK